MLGGKCCFNGFFNMCFIALVEMTQRMLVIMRRGKANLVTGTHLLCANMHWNIKLNAAGVSQGFLKGSSFRAAWSVSQHRFVYCRRNFKKSVHS